MSRAVSLSQRRWRVVSSARATASSGTAPAASRFGLVAQAQLLQVLERGGEVGGGGPGRAVLGRRLEPSGGRHLWAADFQGEQAGQVDDRGGAVGLEVDPALVVAAQVMEEPERWAPPEGRHGQAAEEPPVAGGLADDPPKRRLGLQLAVELAEVEVGGRGQHRVLLRLLDPADELLLPGPQRHPPGRVGGHDVARAADEAALLQGGRQVLGQGGEPVCRPPVGRHRPPPGRGPGRCGACSPGGPPLPRTKSAYGHGGGPSAASPSRTAPT